MSPLISVIIPAYNVEKYLKKCVESVINQTWNNIEIILVNDGSTDNTGNICDELSQMYKNVIVIHQKNKGLSVARNTGLDNCKGEWIAFLDSDDWVDPEMYETLYKVAVENDVCLSSCFSRDSINSLRTDVHCDETTLLLDYHDIVEDLLIGNVMRFEVWNKLWKRSLVGNVRFVPGQVAEDVHFDRILFSKAGSLAHINKAMHNYLIDRPGNTNSSFKIQRLCIFGEFKQWKNDLESNGEMYLASVVSAIAANFAVDIYGNAIVSGQEKEVVNKLIDNFKFFYPAAKEIKMTKKRYVKLKMFDMSPSLWLRFIKKRLS